MEVAWFVCIFALCVFFLCRCEYSQFPPGKNPCLNSPTVPNCIFRLLIYCNIPILKKESHSEISFIHTWLSSLTSKIPSVSNPGHPPSIHEHQKSQHSLKLLNVCSQHCWRSSFLPPQACLCPHFSSRLSYSSPPFPSLVLHLHEPPLQSLSQAPSLFTSLVHSQHMMPCVFASSCQLSV